MTQRVKLYNSAAAFAIGNAVYTETSSGCLRAIVLSANGIRTDIAPEYKRVGALHEDLYAVKLGPTLKARELPVRRELSNGVLQSGRMDFILTNDEIHETKGSYSETVKRGPIGKGEPKLNHLAQLVTYLINAKQPVGKLIYGYYEETPDGKDLVLKAERAIEVRIGEDGTILIDGAISEWNVADQLKHTELAANALTDSQVPPRPINADDGYASPCRFCDFRTACDKYDEGGQNTFFDDAREVVRNHKPAPVKIKRSKR